MSWFHFNLQDFSISFLSILFEGVPFMFIGTLLSGIIDAFVPAETIDRVLPQRRFTAVVLSGVLGIVFPMCECGMVPLVRRLVRKGLPVSCALTYLLSAPIVNPIVGLSTFAAFRGQHPARVTSMRLLLGFALAVLCGLIVQRIPLAEVLNRRMLAFSSRPQPRFRSRERVRELALAHATDNYDSLRPASGSGETERSEDEPAHQHHTSFNGKLLGAVRCAASDFLDVGFYLIIGAAIASVFNTAIAHSALQPIAENHLFATTGMMGLAFLLSLCSTSDAFIAANFLVFPFTAKLAFMVFGPMMDMKLVLMYGLVFTRRFTFAFAFGLFVLVAMACLALRPFFS
jgi:hypothetical protein